MAAPEGDTLVARHMGEQTPMETDDGGRAQFSPPLSTDPETHMTMESDKQPREKEAHPSHRRPLSNQRRRIIYWKCYEALPLWKNTVSLWVW